MLTKIVSGPVRIVACQRRVGHHLGEEVSKRGGPKRAVHVKRVFLLLSIRVSDGGEFFRVFVVKRKSSHNQIRKRLIVGFKSTRRSFALITDFESRIDRRESRRYFWCVVGRRARQNESQI